MIAPTSYRATCPACGDSIEVRTTTKLTSDRAPGGNAALVFIEVDRSLIDRHVAAHEADDEAA